MFLTYVIKVDKREVLGLYFKHIHMLLLFLVFPGKLPLSSKSQFDMFLTYVIKVDKTEALRLYFKHIHVLLLFLGFSGKLPVCGQSE